VGDAPHPGCGARWETEGRYEAAVNHAFKDFPVWGLCPYDTPTAPDYVVEDVTRTHRHIAGADGSHRTNVAYQDPATFIRERLLGTQALPSGPPDIRLQNPTPRAARHALKELVGRSVLTAEKVDSLELAVAELVDNALRTGRLP
jgi:hypothetical protein